MISSYRVPSITAAALVVASMVGTGVYTSLGFQLEHIHSAFAIMALWTLGGLLALCGALSYAELAAMFPRSGGEYTLLSRIYHPSLGFAAGLVSITVGFPAPVALAAKAFGKYGAVVFPEAGPELLSILAVLLATLAHIRNVKVGSRIQTALTGMNVVLILALILTAFGYGTAQPVSFAPSKNDLSVILSGPFAVSLMYVMYAYSGWNAPIYISGELSDASHRIRSALLMGTVLVMLLYIGLNAAFLYVSPMESLRLQVDVGQVAGGLIFGQSGRVLISFLICVGLLGCVSSMMWTGPRVAQTMGEDVQELVFLSATTQDGVPLRATLLQLGIVLVLLITSSFQTILLIAETSLLISSLLCVMGVIVLRMTRPHVERSCPCPLVPFTPLLFSLMTVYMLWATISAHPSEGTKGLLVFVIGGLLFFALRRKSVSS